MFYHALASQAITQPISLVSVPEEGIMSYSDVINPYSSSSSIWQVMLRIQRKRIVALVLPRRRSTDVEEVAS